MTEILCRTKDLKITFPHRLGDFTAVHGFDMEVRRGEIVGLIGESGAGKSTIGNAIMGLLSHPGKVSGGRIDLEGENLIDLSDAAMARLRGRRIGMIFQDPMTSLNPLMTVGDQLAESIALLRDLPMSEARKMAADRLDGVGIPDAASRMGQYPHEFSGGMRQRVVIALAMAGDPDLLIADEPTTALDVSVQKQVLDLIRSICVERSLGVILVTHDMGVIAETADRVYVMRHGKLVETGPTAQVIHTPTEQYTQDLIAAIPSIERREDRFRNPAQKTGEIDQWLLQGHKDESSGDYVTASALTKDFATRKKSFWGKAGTFRAVDIPGLSIKRGEVLGLVGESGSGKSTLGRMMTGLVLPTSGNVRYDDHGPLADVRSRARRKALRRDVQVVFQDPYSSLNGRMRVDHILAEPIRFHGLAARSDIPRLVGALLERVGLPAAAGRKFPHQFSGGQRQRICIARALSVRPRFLLCDEPTSALDVSIQADMLALLMELRRSLGLTMLFVSHDLAVVRQVSDRVAVMKQGKIVECREAEALYDSPENDYTRMLLATAPRATGH
ncbi:dipeptide ABC transporter ATP-binding protein [Sedimentitalea nanhaiensis]|uniref:Peptide/nickel transport system ATP-binding protein n=1 Tax=Sedimentitalea nanhaiensis TaxID=999627 RepID=A0A1I6X386_9RHOB|nr:ABC transporter ATP-binding protein [Sedimentitalea nanhaiensis]SFT32748.1 peptide/nickel transport system ATP-binding protein [Sedimentitalea nanhaiensis]